MFLRKYSAFAGFIIVIATCLSEGAPTGDSSKIKEFSPPMPTTAAENINPMRKEQMHLYIPRIAPLPPGLIRRASHKALDTLEPVNGFKFKDGLNFFPQKGSLANDARRSRRFATPKGPFALRVQGAGEMDKQQQQQQQQQQGKQQQQQQQQKQQQQPEQQRPPQRQTNPETNPNAVVFKGEQPTADEVKVESKAALVRQDMKPEDNGYRPSSSEKNADHAADMAREIAKEVQGKLDSAKRDQKKTDSRNKYDSSSHHQSPPIWPHESKTLYSSSAYVVPPSDKRAGLLKHQLESLVHSALLRKSQGNSAPVAFINDNRLTSDRFDLQSGVLSESDPALARMKLFHKLNDNFPAGKSDVHHRQFLSDLVKVLDRRARVTTLSDPAIKALANKIKSRHYEERLKTGVDNRIGLDDSDDDILGDGDSKSLRRILFPPGANANSNATRIINWKIINRGRQTIIII